MNNKNRMKEFYLLSRRDFIKLGLTGALGIAGGLFSRSLPTALAQTLLSGNGPKRLTPIKPFKFAHVTDTHVSTQGTNGAALKKDSIRIFENVLDQLNAINDLDFILFGGDNFDNSEPGTGDFDTF
ncbi:MAG: metallophosphoesterase, partial [bacterium]|nr:metallophosphoesterase [bacterium]